MTESELLDSITRLFPEGYGLKKTDDRGLDLYYRDRSRKASSTEIDYFIGWWPDENTFLFSDDFNMTKISFFEWLKFRIGVIPQEPAVPVNRYIAFKNDFVVSVCRDHPWLLGLAGCSSLSEIELKLAVMGVDLNS